MRRQAGGTLGARQASLALLEANLRHDGVLLAD